MPTLKKTNITDIGISAPLASARIMIAMIEITTRPSKIFIHSPPFIIPTNRLRNNVKQIPAKANITHSSRNSDTHAVIAATPEMHPVSVIQAVR